MNYNPDGPGLPLVFQEYRESGRTTWFAGGSRDL
jgi:hypothetical protein